MHESDLTAIALKLADGTPVDWERLKAEAPEEYSRLLHRFEQIEHLARVHAPPGSESEQFFDSIRRGVELDGDAPLHWGPLEILRKIGRGWYGDVYLARDPRLDRTVALKLLRKRSADQAGQTESRIIEEARLLARVRHPNVVTVYGAEIIDGRAGVWMEFIDGQTLEEQLQVTGPFSTTAIREIGTALSEALTAIHDAGLLHRDIKTQNVLRERATGRVVLTDFGAGLEYAAPSTGGDVEEFAGTPAYLAPEVLSGASASAQSEVFGLGVLLFRLATGGLPYEGRTLHAIKAAHQARPLSCRSLNRKLPRALARVIDRATEPSIHRRYQSADDLGRALTGFPKDPGRRIASLAVFLVALWGVGLVGIVVSFLDRRLAETVMLVLAWVAAIAIITTYTRRYQSAEALESALRAVWSSSRLRTAALAAVVHLVVSLTLVLFDATFIVAAILMAAYLRLGDFTWLLLERGGITKMLLVAGVTQGSMYYAHLYDLRRVPERSHLFIRIVQALGVASLILAGIYFWFPELPIGRGVAVIASPLVITFVVGWRLLFDLFSRRVSVL